MIERKGHHFFSCKHVTSWLYIIYFNGDLLNSALVIYEEATVQAMVQLRQLTWALHPWFDTRWDCEFKSHFSDHQTTDPQRWVSDCMVYLHNHCGISSFSCALLTLLLLNRYTCLYMSQKRRHWGMRLLLFFSAEFINLQWIQRIQKKKLRCMLRARVQQFEHN